MRRSCIEYSNVVLWDLHSKHVRRFSKSQRTNVEKSVYWTQQCCCREITIEKQTRSHCCKNNSQRTNVEKISSRSKHVRHFSKNKNTHICWEHINEQQQCGREIITRSKHVRIKNKTNVWVGTFRMCRCLTESTGVNHTHTVACVRDSGHPILRHKSRNMHTDPASMSHTCGWRGKCVCVWTSILIMWNEPSSACE